MTKLQITFVTFADANWSMMWSKSVFQFLFLLLTEQDQRVCLDSSRLSNTKVLYFIVLNKFRGLLP